MNIVGLDKSQCSAGAFVYRSNTTNNALLGRPAGPVRGRNGEDRVARRAGLPSLLSRSVHTGRRAVTVRAGAFEEFPFDADDFYRVGLHVVSSPPHAGAVPLGSLVLMREQMNGNPPDHDQRALSLSVSGDTLLAVTAQAQGSARSSRPLSLDLLWQVLERGMETHRGKWQVLRVAIVEIREFCYIGRVFFGNRETGEGAWDCDCRPSDAVWLAQKTHAPIFCRKSVWNANAAELYKTSKQESRTHQQATNAAPEAQATLKATRAMLEKHMVSSTNTQNLIRYDDPEPVKRLKRELGVAVIEQDFAAAARIRDHPFMKLHRDILKQREMGHQEETAKLQMELDQAIAASLRPSQSHSV